MKKCIITVLVFLLMLSAATLSVSAVSSVPFSSSQVKSLSTSSEASTGSSSQSTTILLNSSEINASAMPPIFNSDSHKTQEEIAQMNTVQILENADRFYSETQYTDEQKHEADAALAQIYQSLYLDINGETEETEYMKGKAVEYINRQSPGLRLNKGSMMLLNYMSLANFQKTGEIIFDSKYGGNNTGAYTVMAEDENGRVVSMILLSWSGEIRQSAGCLNECEDLRSHAVKAYELLKKTDLDLSKTKAVFFRMHMFYDLYYLTDGNSQYFLTFGSIDKAAGDLYYEQNFEYDNIEQRMRVVRYEDMFQIIQAIDTSSMEDHPITWIPQMGGDSLSATPEAQTPAQDSPDQIWLWAIVAAAVIALVLVVVRVVRKKKAN